MISIKRVSSLSLGLILLSAIAWSAGPQTAAGQRPQPQGQTVPVVVTVSGLEWNGRVQTNRTLSYPFEAGLRPGAGYEVRRVQGFDGLRPGDLIMKAGGVNLTTNRIPFMAPLQNFSGKSQVLQVLREGSTLTVKCPLYPPALVTALKSDRYDFAHLIGVECEDAGLPCGARILSVVAGGLAEAVGLRKNDVILSLNRIVLEDASSLTCLSRVGFPGRMLEIEVIRDGLTLRVSGTFRPARE